MSKSKVFIVLFRKNILDICSFDVQFHIHVQFYILCTSHDKKKLCLQIESIFLHSFVFHFQHFSFFRHSVLQKQACLNAVQYPVLDIKFHFIFELICIDGYLIAQYCIEREKHLKSYALVKLVNTCIYTKYLMHRHFIVKYHN